MSNIHAYTDYQLVEESEEYEYRNSYFFYAGTLVSNHLWRRSVHTKTWEATPTDAVSGSPSQYNYEQGYPGSVNPGNLQYTDGWRLQSVEYTKSISTPLSKDVRETWVLYGNWEDLGEQVPPNPQA